MFDEEKSSITQILITIGKGINQIDHERRQTEEEEKQNKKKGKK